MNYDDETLMAYVDGELDAKTRAEIASAVDQDPALARRVEQHRALRSRLTGAFNKVLNQPVPEQLANVARGKLTPAPASGHGKVLQFPARAGRAPATPWRAREWVAMAASLLLGALISWRVLAPGEGESIVAGNDALVARGELARALDVQLASEQRGEEPVLIGLTFKARDGSYCRSFVMSAARTAGLACRAGADWQLTATESVSPSQGQLHQAGSALSPAILRAIESRGEGAALDAEAERSAQASGWKSASPN